MTSKILFSLIAFLFALVGCAVGFINLPASTFPFLLAVYFGGYAFDGESPEATRARGRRRAGLIRGLAILLLLSMTPAVGLAQQPTYSMPNVRATPHACRCGPNCVCQGVCRCPPAAGTTIDLPRLRVHAPPDASVMVHRGIFWKRVWVR